MDATTLQNTVLSAINSFDDNRGALLTAAQQQGGDDAVNKLLAGYNSLRAQYMQLIATELATNNPAYGDLSDKAFSEATDLKNSINSMNDINQTITIISSVVSVVASVAALV